MSSYDEHLISMAGGDGDDAEIRSELKDISALLTLIKEHQALREVVKEQQATIDRALNLANTRGRCGWSISSDELRRVLGAS